jgi:hypothetical protein
MVVLLTWIVFFQEIPVFVHVSSRCLLEAKGADLHLEKPMLEDVFLSKTNKISTLKSQSWRMYSFQKLTQFPQKSNVSDATASDTNGFIFSIACVSSTLLKRPVWKEYSLSTPWKS